MNLIIGLIIGFLFGAVFILYALRIMAQENKTLTIRMQNRQKRSKTFDPECREDYYKQ
jgi:hypothetical protein